jgi:hypothetical protein
LSFPDVDTKRKTPSDPAQAAAAQIDRVLQKDLPWAKCDLAAAGSGRATTFS